jgi:hypothetical protein
MKDEKQIEKILESNQVSVMQVPMLHSDDYGKTAKEIASLYEGWYPKEFIFWMNKYITQYRYECDKSEIFFYGSWKSLPALFKYWQDNVEGK